MKDEPRSHDSLSPRCLPTGSDEFREIPWEGAEELAALAKAIAHPVRVRIIRALTEREACVCGELVGEFSLAQSTVSQHLKILKEAGLVRGEIQPPHVCYFLESGALRRLNDLVADLASANAGGRSELMAHSTKEEA